MPEYADPVSHLGITFEDNSREYSNISINLTDLTAINFVAVMAEKELLIAAIRNVTLCNPWASSVSVEGKVYNMGVPASEWAQRELGLQVGYHDVVNGRKGHITIPGVDWASLKGLGDEVDYTNIQWLSLAAAMNLTAKSRDGNDILVDYGRLVGRRS